MSVGEPIPGKEPVELEGLDEIARGFVERIVQGDAPPEGAVYIADIQLSRDSLAGSRTSTTLRWAADDAPGALSRARRCAFEYTHNLGSVAEYPHEQPVTTPLMSVVFATFEQVRLGLGATDVHFVGEPSFDVATRVYMK
jgi:hypothetical protein